MTVLREDIKKAAEKVAQEWGFSSIEDFVNEAVEERILEFKKHNLLKEAIKSRKN